MNWILIPTSEELGYTRGTPEELRGLLASALARIDPGLLVKSGPRVAAPDEPIKDKLAALVAFGDP